MWVCLKRRQILRFFSKLYIVFCLCFLHRSFAFIQNSNCCIDSFRSVSPYLFLSLALSISQPIQLFEAQGNANLTLQRAHEFVRHCNGEQIKRIHHNEFRLIVVDWSSLLWFFCSSYTYSSRYNVVLRLSWLNGSSIQPFARIKMSLRLSVTGRMLNRILGYSSLPASERVSFRQQIN